MASRDFLKHVVSTTEPTDSTLGDEWYNPSTNILSKRLVVNGTTVRFVPLGGGLAVQQSGSTIVSNTSTLNFPGASVSHNPITGVTDISASGVPGGSNTQVQFNNVGAFAGSSNFTWTNGTQTLAITGFTSSNQLRALGGLNASTWTTTGPVFNTSGSLTDVSGSGGTVALRTSTSFNTNTWTASVSTTVTDAATIYVESPTASTNISITNPYSIYASGLVRASGFVAGASRVVDYKNATAQQTLSGGGLVTWNGTAVLWSQRVIAIPVENTEMGSAGYFDITCPTSGTVVYYNSANVTTTLTCTAAGVPLGAWEALYYEVAEGQGSGTDQTRFRVVNYQNSTWRPSTGWILLASVNGDGTNIGHLRWLPGQINLPTTGATVTYNTGTGISSWAVGTGTVTSVSVVSANGFAGTVATASSTPAITISTSITGLLKGNGTAIQAATAGTDYIAPYGSTTANTFLAAPNGSAGTPSFRAVAAADIPTLNQATTAGAGVLRQTDGTTFQTPTDPRAVSGSRTTVLNANQYAYGIFSEFKNSSAFSFTGTYTGLITYANYNGTVASTGDPSYQLAFHPSAANSTANPSLKFRAGIDTTWGTWGEISHTQKTNLNIQYNSIGIGIAASGTQGSLIHSVASLGGTAGNLSTTLASYRGALSNASLLDINFVRDSTGADWTTAGTRIQQKIDATWMAYQQFNGTNAQGGIEWGSGSTTVAATSIAARMRLDSGGILRLLTNSGSTSSTTGTLVVTGGAGISENLYVGNYTRLTNGAVRTNARNNTSELYPVGHFTSGECVFEIDPTMTQTELQNYFNTTGVSWNNDTTAPGYCIQMDGAINFGAGAYGSGFPRIPVETTDIFYMEFWWRNDAAYAGPGHYAGGVSMDATGTVLSGNPGSFDYWLFSNTAASTTWTKYGAYVTGFAASGSAAGTFPTNAKYWSPLVLANYSFTSGTRRSYMSGWKVYRVYQPGNRKFVNHVAYSVNAAVTAAGTTQGTATAISTDINNITAGTGGVILPFWQAGHRVTVRNALAVTVNVYPNSGGQINSLGANAAFALTAGSTVEFINISSTLWTIVNAVYA